MLKITQVLLLASTLVFGFTSFAANETVGEKIEEGAADMQKGTKKAYRKVKDETCEWVNGKMECAGKKVKNKAKNVGDEIKDKTDTE